MSDLKTVLINDARIEDISGDISFSVQGGAQQNTFQPQMANTSSNTSHSWQINVPSENIVVDRRLLIDTDVVFVINVTNVPANEFAMDWGVDIGFGPYPLNSCYLTQNALINNCGLTVNTQDIMAPLLRMNDQMIHTHYDGWTPSMVDDTFYYYSAAVGASNNPLSGVKNGPMNNKIRGRGCHPIEVLSVVHTIAATGAVNALLQSTAPEDTFVITIKTHLTEPILFLSPFISNPTVANEAGFLGINNMTFNFTIDNALKRVFRTAKNYTYTFGFGNVAGNNSGWSNLRILMNYLSVQPSQYAKISARNILPLLQYDRYITNNGNNQLLIADTEVKYSSSNIALNQIPDSLIIFGRVPMSQQSSKNSDSFFTIKSISVNFNNVSGLLASCTPQELWLLSQKAGSSQAYNEFSGYNYAAGNNTGEWVPSTGSLLVLQPAFCFNLPDYLSSSSLGSYNLQFDLTLYNQSNDNITPEIVVISVTSGYMSIHQGSAQSFSGVLNKEMVMNAKDGAAVPRLSQSDYERLVGGTMNNRGVANLTKMLKNRRGPQISVESGGAISGGVMSGGKLGKYLR